MKPKAMIKTARTKRKARPAAPQAKKLRSRISRRRRSLFSTILCKSRMSADSNNQNKRGVHVFGQFPMDSSGSSYLPGEFSCGSSGFSVVSGDLKVRPPRKRAIDEIAGASGAVVRKIDQFRRFTRSCSKEKENERIGGARDFEVEASDSSCVESSSRAELRGFGNQNWKAKSTAGDTDETVKRTGSIVDSVPISRCDLSCVEQFSTTTDEISREFEPQFQKACSSIYKLISGRKTIRDKGCREAESIEASKSCVTSTSTVSNSESNKERKPASSAYDSNLLCTEYLWYDDISDYTSSMESTFSDNFQESSEANFSDYSPSMWTESFDPSGSEFSERSQEDCAPSPTFSLFLQYSDQFVRLGPSPPSKASSRKEYQDEFTALKFKDDEDEESYRSFRNRERRQMSVENFEEYYSATVYHDLVLEQRLQMVHWIVEQSAAKELQNETMFLGVNLFDRFLSKGFFKNKKSLQTAGIACLALAIRIEENQPLNTVREDVFCIESNLYSRCEVVAMEWLVQKVLNFQCFLPTIYNFLWFYLKAAKANREVEKRAKYLAVLVLLDHEQLCYWPSTVAAGLVILASLGANQENSCQWVMMTHVRTEDDDLPECIKSLEWLIKYVC